MVPLAGKTEPPTSTMVLQVLDLVNSNEQFYGDCPIATYTDLDVNTSGHTTCTIMPQGTKVFLFLIILLSL